MFLLALAIALAAPLGVVGLYAELTTGQVALTKLQQQLTAEQQRQSALELRLAELQNPSTIVAEARVQGMVPATSVVEIPEVPLGVVPTAKGGLPSRPSARSASTRGTRR